MSRYGESTIDDPVSHLVDTSQQFPSEVHPEGTYWFPPSPEPDRSKLYQYVHSALFRDDAFAEANVILVLTDTRDIKGQEHWPHTARLIIERCRMVSQHGELWTPIYIPLCNDTGLELIHYTWGGVYVLEALALLFPGKIHIMWDHDAAPTSLWEVQDVVPCLHKRIRPATTPWSMRSVKTIHPLMPGW